MTPESKAKELIAKYLPLAREHKRPMYYAKKCAIIDVNNTINAVMIGYLINDQSVAEWQLKQREFWVNIKKELEK